MGSAEIRTRRCRRPAEAAEPPADDAPVGLDAEAQLYSSLRILGEREQQLFRYRFDHHSVSRRVLSELLTRTGRLQDSIKSEGLKGYREPRRKSLDLPIELRLALSLYRRLDLSRRRSPASSPSASNCS